MKLFYRSFFQTVIFILMYSANYGQVKIKSAQISLFTPFYDDKDWDTQVTVSLYLSDGTLVGTANYNSCDINTPPADVPKCFCCVKPIYDTQGHITNINTMYTDGSSRGPFEINLSNLIEKSKIKTGFFRVSVHPNGNDRWIFIPSLTLNFNDNTKVSFTSYPPTIVDQDASEATLVFF